MRRAREVARSAAVAVALVLGLAATAAAQPRAAPVTAPAPADTVLLSLGAATGAPRPTLTIGERDTLRFGEPFTLTCEFPAGATVLADSVTARADWIAVVAREAGPAPTGAAQRVVLTLRPYRPGPFRLAWEGEAVAGPVRRIAGRLDPAAEPLPVRDPRRLPRSWWLAALGLLLAAIAAVLVWLWRRQRRAKPDGIDEPLPLPAWLQAAQDLDALLAERLLERGEGRVFLHRLDAAFRRYLAARYRFAALEMTATEVAAALEALRHPAAVRRAAAGILGRCDALRFAPAAALPADGRDLLALVVGEIGARREPLRYTPVPPAVLLESERCWERVLAVTAGGRGGGHA